MKKLIGLLGLTFLLTVAVYATDGGRCPSDYVTKILNNTLMNRVDSMARKVVATGFNAGDGYGEVWIRDYNTFIELSMEVMPDEVIRHNLNTFFHFQGPTGDVVDGFIPIKQANGGYKYRMSKDEPRYAAHKNTVETDHETSLVQAIYKYVKKSGNTRYLNQKIAGKTVYERMEWALDYLMKEKMNEKYGLIIGATTADWGDVQPEHLWGVEIDENTHYAIDIYDNAMLVLALNDFIELSTDRAKIEKWSAVRETLKTNIRKHLWDSERQKFIPHIYLNGSPFPENFDENKIYYHGGTAVAIEAGLLSQAEIAHANRRMLENMAKAHAQTIGLTLYPTYPAGSFKGVGMYPYGYQNGGDWTWFGARMIQTLVNHGFIAEAYDELQPMLARVIENNGFYEWYTPAGEPMGSGTFRGEAGVLYKAIALLKGWAKQELAQCITNDRSLAFVDSLARRVIDNGLNAGSGYSQVWARDMNTFIETACEEFDAKVLRGAILLFFRMQQPNNEMIDGYVLKKDFTWHDDTPYYSSLAPGHVGFKNTVETDQESSLIQLVYKYIQKTGDRKILQTKIGGRKVIDRMADMIDYLMKERYSETYGLIYGAMTADWGDVQPKDDFGCDMNELSTPAIDVYDNAMLILALDAMKAMDQVGSRVTRWDELRNRLAKNVRQHLWDAKRQKFIPHLYLKESPIPEGFDENTIHYHGGTAVAIEAGLLTKDEIAVVNAQMVENVRLSGMPSIGLTLYPVYPEGFFHGGMAKPYVYQNGGDWTWFGGRMIQQLIAHGFVAEAYDEVRPMIDRVVANKGFYEWYGQGNVPSGSGSFKGSAGVLAKAIELFRTWAKQN
ncbi:MAG: GH36-type glycosyl hydrolase domain-containing protein [Bacteroides sp.]